MIWLLSRLIVWPVKAAVGTAALGTKATAKTASGSARLGYRTGKLFGYRNLVLLAVGVGLGVAVAPGPGKEVRDKVRQRLVERGLIKGGTPPAPTSYTAPIESPSAVPDVAAAESVSTNGAAGLGVTTTASVADLPLEGSPEEPGTTSGT